MLEPICLKPVGFVEEGIPRLGEPYRPESRYEIISTIKILDEYVEALEGLQEYSHIIVIYWMHEEKRYKPKVKPWGIERYPEVGIFATRFPPRPNLIALTVAELIAVEGNKLKVRGLDAWTGSPVIDIKPYDYYDIVKNPRIPWWLEERWKELSEKKNYKTIAPWLGP
ncbi:MAG: tRNA (N6-threonylcarbamoyladenosine(37)-N6)-methyltransferase TrmO [Thermoprotei archaeon]|nr:tRNA (N6-threonylcarbamoyladenosine(37)-N6)-methyltransferase TrmO [Thermoprotei archaeon]